MPALAPAWPCSLPVLIGLALVLGFLYVAKVVVIPLALAILITFLLAPPVMWMQRRGVPRVPAVMLATTLALAGPLAVVPAGGREEFDIHFPRVAGYVPAPATLMAAAPVDDDLPIHILGSRDWPASTRDAETGWPCVPHGA